MGKDAGCLKKPSSIARVLYTEVRIKRYNPSRVLFNTTCISESCYFTSSIKAVLQQRAMSTYLSTYPGMAEACGTARLGKDGKVTMRRLTSDAFPSLLVFNEGLLPQFLCLDLPNIDP
ncbi:hypothetical protein L249_7874 [Ophiocordyceps polyrhachis-furcata BCC 54312]|uniref:Uncharacterized protein n=1 Tax=Ophiocordyceps polyrhachis-furcata BCC 54312 TaxID=1330021 RepID=A0A367L0L5_9HYPO|nr:hypothetical protein L249_7874 [Ophiocordyceps polyrhachis-furcata BCC 54312]